MTWSPVSLSSLPRYPRLFIDALGKVLYANAYFRSIDGGKTWTSCKANIETTIADQVIAIDPRDSNHVFAATYQKGDMYVMSSTDGCQSWRPLLGLGYKYVNSLAIDPNNPDLIYVATDTGGLFSYDSGGYGAPINEGLLGNLVVYSIAINPQSGVYAATPFGIFKLETKK